MHDEILASKIKEIEDNKRKCSLYDYCCCISEEYRATETLPRIKIPGQELTDFIEVGTLKPFSDVKDAFVAIVMISLVALSVLKFNALREGYIFLTFSSFSDWQISSFQMDMMETMIWSPRLLALWTMCFLNNS